MRRTGRRHSSDYLEENKELYEDFNNEETAEEYSEYIEFDPDEFPDDAEEENSPSKAIVIWKAIGKVAIVILALIALFFISMEVTKIWLDRNQEPSSYGNDAPIYDDSDFEEPDATIDDTDDTEDEKPVEDEDEDDEDAPSSKPSTDKPSTNKPSTDKPSTDKPSTDKPSTDKPSTDKPSTDKPSTDTPSTDKPSTDKPSTDKPSTDTPSTDKPSTPETPSTPSKPIIVPGNPAA